jgi:hypothetical protein
MIWFSKSKYTHNENSHSLETQEKDGDAVNFTTYPASMVIALNEVLGEFNLGELVLVGDRYAEIRAVSVVGSFFLQFVDNKEQKELPKWNLTKITKAE